MEFIWYGTPGVSGKPLRVEGMKRIQCGWSKDFENIDLYEDINKVTAEGYHKTFGKPDVIWASPTAPH